MTTPRIAARILLIFLVVFMAASTGALGYAIPEKVTRMTSAATANYEVFVEAAYARDYLVASWPVEHGVWERKDRDRRDLLKRRPWLDHFFRLGFPGENRIEGRRVPRRQGAIDRYVLSEEWLKKVSPGIKRISIYAEDMRSGTSFGINENDLFHAASTSKLAFALAGAEVVYRGQASYDDYIRYAKEFDYEEGDGILLYEIQENAPYSVRSLQELALVESDNIAFHMMTRYYTDKVGGRYFDMVDQTLGASRASSNWYSTKELAQSVRKLCERYQSNPHTSTLVTLLEQASFNEYITKTIPEGMFFHKYGHYYDDVNGNYANDIGVVYGEYPVLFSVMIEWEDQEPTEAMGFLSRYFYYLTQTEYFPANSER